MEGAKWGEEGAMGLQVRSEQGEAAGSGCNGVCRIQSFFFAASPPPFSPQTSASYRANAGLRRPIAEQEAYGGLKGFKSRSPPKTFHSATPTPETSCVFLATVWGEGGRRRIGLGY